MPEELEEKTTIDEQDNQNGNHSDDGEKSNGGEANDTPKVKVGDAEYTPEELAEIVKKGSQYDELLPDYTRKSQELAKINSNKDPQKQEEENLPPYLREGWEPKTYAELAEAMKIAEERGMQRALEKFQEKDNEIRQAREQVDNFVKEIKGTDKGFNESDFFNYVLRHNLPVNGIDELRSAYSVYKELNDARKGTQIQKTPQDKVNKGGEQNGGKEANFTDIRARGGSIFEAVREGLHKIK